MKPDLGLRIAAFANGVKAYTSCSFSFMILSLLIVEQGFPRAQGRTKRACEGRLGGPGRSKWTLRNPPQLFQCPLVSMASLPALP